MWMLACSLLFSTHFINLTADEAVILFFAETDEDAAYVHLDVCEARGMEPIYGE